MAAHRVVHAQQRVAQAQQRGLTLIEVMVAMGLSSLVLVGVTGVYYFAISQWNTGAAETDAFVAASQAADRLGEEIARGRSAVVEDLSGGREALKVRVFPQGADLEGADYFTEAGDAGYDPGESDEYWYYLSDNTGSINTSGDILWRAFKSADGSLTPDSAWTFYEGTTEPRVSGVTSLDFYTAPWWNLARASLTVEGTESHEKQARTIECWFYLRNHE